MTRNHAPDAEALRSAPRVLMVGEAPPAAGLGPLGAFDCASGWGLARLDPHHGDLVDADSHRPGAADAKRAMVESTLGLFDRVNLLDAFPGRRVDGKGDHWPDLEGKAAAQRLLPSWAGRRVALMGRRVARSTAKAGGVPWRGVEALPIGRWLAMGGPGEPAEVCVLPHPSPTNRELNPGKPDRAVLTRWIAAERQRLRGEAAWMRLDAFTAYRYSDGAWLGGPSTPRGTTTTLDPVAEGPAWRARVLREVAVNCTGQGRFTGRAMSVTAHHLLVDEVGAALLAADGRTVATTDAPAREARLAVECLTHDLREGLTHDLTSPLKSRHPGYRADERRAAAAVDGLLHLPPAPAALAAVAHRADVLVREVEAVVLWGMPLDDARWPAHLLGEPEQWERRVRFLMQRSREGLLQSWIERLRGALGVLGSDLVLHLRE